MRTGILERGIDPKGPELFVSDLDGLTYPVAAQSPQELPLLRTWIGRTVKFTPKILGTRTNASTGKLEAIVFATNIETVGTMRPTINGIPT